MSSTLKEATRSSGFEPVACRDARVLILGSLPGKRSIEQHEYYAHPRNAFWSIMRELVDAAGSYDQRCAALRKSKIAVWDVLASSVRPGSLDADIDLVTARVNDFQTFFSEHPGVHRICFNGQTAARIYRQRVSVSPSPADLRIMPSTSPAYAAMKQHEKLELWRAGIGLNKGHE